MTAKVTKNITIATRGVGKPDYSREISSALIRRGIRLGYSQSLKIFTLIYSDEVSPYSWVGSPLSAGSTAHLIDNETGLVTPFTVPKGYIFSIIEVAHSTDEDTEIWAYVDGYLYTIMGIVSGGQQILENMVVSLTTAVIDPTGATSHLLDITVKNIGAESLKGGFGITAILKAVGTPPLPTTKTVRCKFCDYEETVPRETTQWICPRCGKLNIFYDLSKFRG